MNSELKKTLIVATLVSLVCAILISTAAVVLRPMQQANILLDKQKNILQAAGIYDAELPIPEQFKKITSYVVEFKSGKIQTDRDALTYNPLKAAKTIDDKVSVSMEKLGLKDAVKIKRLENYSLVYLVHKKNKLDKIILPIRGYGLWSTLYGFIALEADANTIAGMGFYQHGETPGLGAEIDNPKWKKLWIGKKIFDKDGYAFEIVKGMVPDSSKKKIHQVDGLAGATITARGVDNLVKFWLGKHGFGTFLERAQNNEILTIKKI